MCEGVHGWLDVPRGGDFSPEFKAEAIRLVTETQTPITKIARDLGVHPASIRHGVNAARPQPRELSEDERRELLR
jgi:transposase-like protein